MNDIETQIPLSQEQIIEYRHNELKNEQEYYEHLNKSIMKTGTFTSTIKNIASAKVWGEGQKQTTYYNLEMDNGDKINIGKKITLLNGNELSYEILEVDQQEYCTAKAWNPDYDNSQASSPQPNNNGISQSQAEKLPGFALRYATDQYIGQGLPTGMENNVENVANYTHGLADLHLEWLKNNS